METTTRLRDHPWTLACNPMPDQPQPRNSFVLRIWREEEDGREQSIWRGWIQHVRSGEEVYVQNQAELIQFIEQHTGKLEDARHSLARLR